jgi:hypothetical protein
MDHNQFSRLTPQRIVRSLSYRAKIATQGVAGQFVNFYFGNTSGWVPNVSASHELTEFRRGFSEIPWSEEDKTRAAELDENGFVLLGRVSSRDLVDRVASAIRYGFDTESDSTVWSPNGAYQVLIDPEATIPGLRDMLDPIICRVISAYYNTAFQVKTVRVWRNHHVPNVDGDRSDVFSNTFHHDNCKVTGLRVFILLTDGVDRNTGAFRFHDRKTSEGIVRSFGYFHRFMLSKSMIRRLTNPDTLRYFEGNTGDVAVVNTQQCLHAASVPKEPGSYRDILQFEVYPAAGQYREGPVLLGNMQIDTEIHKMRDAHTKDT